MKVHLLQAFLLGFLMIAISASVHALNQGQLIKVLVSSSEALKSAQR